MSEKMTMTVPGTPDYIMTVKMAIASVAAHAGFDVEKLEDIKLAVCEACKCAVCHCHDKWSTGIQVECEVFEDRMEIAVLDDKRLHTIEKEYHPCTICPDEGGFARGIVETLCTSISECQVDEFIKKTVLVIEK